MHCGPRILTCISFTLGGIAVVTLALSVSTDAWLYSMETFADAVENRSSIANFHRSGLWRICALTISPDGTQEISACHSIDHSANDHRESFDTIKGSNKSSAIFPVTSLVLLTLATVLSVLGNIKRDFKTLVSAVTYILAGLSLGVGIILYISVINDQVSHRMQEKSTENLIFQYWYGWSFYFAGVAFLCSMLSAVILISLFLKRNSRKEEMLQIIPGLDDVIETSDSKGQSNPTLIL